MKERKFSKTNLIILGILAVILIAILSSLNLGSLISGVESNSVSLNLLVFIMAGLVDGINPCALSMLLFFMMTALNMDREKTNIMLIGVMFALGTFIAYFSAGLGLVRLIRYIEVISYLPPLIYGVTVLVAFALGIWNFRDAYYAKKQDLKNVTLQLPSKNKKFIHNMIKKISVNKYKYPIALALGFLVTLAELLCTGQIYFAAMLALQSFGSVSQTLYLVIFNIGFILPILIITYIIHRTKEMMSFSEGLLNRLWLIKTITGVVMIVLGFYILSEFFKYVL
ncbi:hypothetical protein RH915_04715 [Serpentinicella sp. ANB-PHB4]|uniref:cytochrome c biogenesis CcdA family protein n=1 Tax=Serpentinicella sp. ANB-PHB4 TaxID=3074076 RepID=UPI002859CB1C|nr:hypothetical protein [Serpentinicella sp. ANB-PHB4]MDR5658786.1 hypothetical protein [Serpentinicella sp. ANB-PHB4]